MVCRKPSSSAVWTIASEDINISIEFRLGSQGLTTVSNSSHRFSGVCDA